jgi:Pin2-interacting protein X1
MVSQGWKPGEYLGARDAPHAEFHTAANASYIRAIFNNDNLGLGAKRGIEQAVGKNPGLDSFQKLLGRLNGKNEDELAKEQKLREDLRRADYTERRWSKIQFVKGGYLTGDKIHESVESETGQILKVSSKSCSGTVVTSEKRDPGGCLEFQGISESFTGSKFQNKPDFPMEFSQDFTLEKINKVEITSNESDSPPSERQGDNSQTPRARLRKEKKRKGRSFKRRDRAKTKSAKEESPAKGLTHIATAVKNHSEKLEIKSLTVDNDSLDSKESPLQGEGQISLASPAVALNRSGPQLLGRHVVRSRAIAQKRLAALDPASLNEVSSILIISN